MLSEDAIAPLLAELVEHLESASLDQARLTIVGRLADFERLTRPIADSTRTLQFIDPAADFGVDRVHETWDQIRQCLRAVNANNAKLALKCAKAATERWARP